MAFYSRLADVNLESFTHNNMVPFFGSGIKQNISEDMNQTLLGKYTGYDDIHIEKKEVNTFNDIFKNNTGHEHKDYIFEYDRLEQSRYKNNVLPVEQIKVGPGTIKTDLIGPTGGFQQEAFRDFNFYKNIDELRVQNNPQESFEGRMVDGIKETKVGKIGDFNKNRPDTFYEQNEDNLFKTTGAYLKDKERPCVDVKETNRKDSTQIVGPGFKNVGNKKIPQVQESTKRQFNDFGSRNANLQNIGKGSQNDYGRTNIMVYNNERDLTSTNTHQGNFSSYIKSMIAPFTDILRTTNKEFFVQNKRDFGNLQITHPKKQTVHDTNNVPKTTIKETLVHDTHSGNINGFKQITTYDPNDIARTTIKETNIHDATTGNLSTYNKSIVYDPSEVAKNTGRQTLETIDSTINMHNHSKPTLYNPNNPAKTTVKETTIDNDSLGIVSGNDKGGGHLTNEFNVKHINREILANTSYTGNPENTNSDGYLNANVNAKVTNKQITSDNEYFGQMNSEVDRMKSYEDIYNAVINETKEKTLVKPPPTQNGVKVASGSDKVHLTHHKNNLKQQTLENIYKIYQNAPSKEFVNISQKKNVIEPKENIIDPSLLNAFRSNPYTHPLTNAV
jgi:hypothetical protein